MLLLLVLSAMILGSQAISEQCGRSPSLKFSVSSWRNESGHRLVAADVQSGEPFKDSVSLSVEMFSQKCGDNRAVILKTLSSSGQSEEQEPISTTVAPTVLPLPGYHHIPGFGYYKKISKDNEVEGWGRGLSEGTYRYVALGVSGRDWHCLGLGWMLSMGWSTSREFFWTLD